MSRRLRSAVFEDHEVVIIVTVIAVIVGIVWLVRV